MSVSWGPDGRPRVPEDTEIVAGFGCGCFVGLMPDGTQFFASCSTNCPARAMFVKAAGILGRKIDYQGKAN